MLPDVCAVAEQGFPDFDVKAWFGIVAPAARRRRSSLAQPPDRAALQLPDVRARLAGIGMDPVTMTPEQFAQFIRDEIARWAPVVKASGAKVD